MNILNSLKSKIQSNISSRDNLILGILISFPKSGRTWIRVMLDQLGISLDYTHAGSAYIDNRHFRELTIDKDCYRNRKCIFLHRDPRDVVISGYFQATSRKNLYNGNLKSFIKNPYYGIEKIITFNKLWINFAYQENFHIISYERIYSNTEKELIKLINYLNVNNIKSEDVQKAIDFASLKNLQKLEKQGSLAQIYGKRFQPTDPNQKESYKARRGIVGGYFDYLDQEDVEYCNSCLENYSYFDSIKKIESNIN